MRITLSSNEVSAEIVNGTCHQVDIHVRGMKPITPSQVQELLDRGFEPRRALAGCVAWEDSYCDEGEGVMLHG
jgi:hypothetical protein